MDRAFTQLEKNIHGAVKVNDLLKLLAILFEGTDAEKLKLLYEIYDVNGKRVYVSTVSGTYRKAIQFTVHQRTRLASSLSPSLCSHCTYLDRNLNSFVLMGRYV